MVTNLSCHIQIKDTHLVFKFGCNKLKCSEVIQLQSIEILQFGAKAFHFGSFFLLSYHVVKLLTL